MPVPPPPNYGGFAGRPMPPFAPGTVLWVTYWAGSEFAAGLYAIGDEALVSPYAIGPGLDWRAIQTWQIVEVP